MPISSTCTSTPSTRFSTARAGSPTSSPAPPSSRCRPSASPTTARWPAPSSSSRRRGNRRQADHRLRGLRRRRPPRPGEGQRPPHAARRRQHRLLEPDQALLARLPRGLLLQAARRLGAPRAPQGRLIALSGCLSGRVCRALEENRPTDAQAELDRLAQVFGADNVYVELQNAHLDVQQRILPQLAELAPKRACRRSRPATSTTSATPTRAPTRRSSASSPATRSRTRTTGSSTPTTSTSSRPRRWRSTSPATTTRCAARSRSPSAATSRSSSAGSCCRTSRCPTAARRSTTSSSSAKKACKSATESITPS